MSGRRTRPRGFAPWQPQAGAVALVETIQDILDRYLEYLPITLRQLFYILVSQHGHDKTERAYQRLTETCGRARRAKLLPMDSFRDDGHTKTHPPGWQSPDALVSSIRAEVDGFRLDRQEGQLRRLIVWCEAAGMVPQLQRVADDYGVPVHSSGGFDSLTAKHEAGRTISTKGATEVLHIGDLDPSGVHVFGSLDEDVRAFAGAYGGDVRFTRLAATPEQVDEMNLSTAPPKATDRRSFDHTWTVQAEAIPPDQLAAIVRAAIVGRLDHQTFEDILAQEDADRADLQSRLQAAGL